MTDTLVFIDSHHVYCQATGYCTSCGVHREMAEREYLDCVHGNNVLAMSHLRMAAIAAAKEKANVG